MEEFDYKLFKKKIQRLHKKGYTLQYMCEFSGYNDDDKENIIVWNVNMYKEGKDRSEEDFS